MNSKSTSFTSSQSFPAKPENILQHWGETTAEFYQYYNQLTRCLKEKVLVGDRTKLVTNSTGKPSVSQLIKLLKTMEFELEALLLDIDGLAPGASLQLVTEYSKLVGHNRRLKKLNQQAKAMLSLMAFSEENNRGRLPSGQACWA